MSSAAAQPQLQPQPGPPGPPPQKGANTVSNFRRTVVPTCVVAVLLAAIVYVGLHQAYAATRAWTLTMGLMFLLFLYLGTVISGRPLGILVGSRNLISLSRFQTVAWTMVLLSAFLTVAFRRIMADLAAPLDISMDPHLWALMGISTASLISTPLILQNKVSKDPANAKAMDSASKSLNENVEDIEKHRQGLLYANPSIQDARLTDMIEGDEVGNTAYIDISKVQMLLFTVVILVAYCYSVYNLLGQLGAGKIVADKLAMPALSDGVIALLGISHAGYLGSKAADHTPSVRT